MGLFKKDKNYVEIETKVTPIPYMTVHYEDRPLMFHDYPTTAREWQVLTGMFMLMLTAALADCINPDMITAHGDAQLKQNYLDVFALGERFGVIERNDEAVLTKEQVMQAFEAVDLSQEPEALNADLQKRSDSLENENSGTD